MERRLAAILAADVVGYSRLLGADEAGTNLAMARLAGAAEFWLDKPVIAVNTATYWWALRQNGIADKIEGFGSLLAEH